MASSGQPLVMHCVHRNPAVPPSFDSAMVVKDSLVHEVDVTRFLFGEEIASVQIIKPTSNPRCTAKAQDPQIAIFGPVSGRHVDVEVFVTTGVAYEVRTEVVGEHGSATIGLDVGLVRKSAPGTWGGTDHAGLPGTLRHGLRHRDPAVGRRRARPASMSTGRPRGTVTPPRRSAKRASGRWRPASASMSSLPSGSGA